MTSILDNLDDLGAEQESEDQAYVAGAASSFRELFTTQQADQSKVLGRAQISALDGLRAEMTLQLKMRRWAKQQVGELCDRIVLESITPQQWERLQTDLLPITRELYGRIDLDAALILQELAMMQKLEQHSQASVTTARSALQGMNVPALMLTGSN